MRREKRKKLKTLSASDPTHIRRRKGRPIQHPDDPHHLRRRDTYQTGKQRELLEAICLPLGINPSKEFEKIINNVSQTKQGKTMLPNIGAQSNTVAALAEVIATNQRSTVKQGLIRSLSEMNVKRSDLSTALNINPMSVAKYKGRTNKNAKAAAIMLLKKTRADVRRNKIVPGESEATIQHAKDKMYCKSGGTSDVFVLPSQLKQLYVNYRLMYHEVVQRIVSYEKNNSQASNRSLTFENNARLISEAIYEVEPWSEHITSVKKWVGHRKAAGLSTSACTNLIVNDDGQMVVVEVAPLTGAANKSEPPMDYATVPSQLEAQLARSKADKDQLRPRSYKTWKAIITNNKDFRWRQLLQPYSCDTCTKAPGVERQWETAQLGVKNAVPKTPEQSLAISAMYWAYQDMSDLEQHKQQLRNQRVYLQNLEKALPPKSKDMFKVIVYVDFVAQYNYKKKKVANLVFTIKWRDENGHLQYKYIDNFCSDTTQKADCMFVHSAWKFHLRANYLRHQLLTVGVLSAETRLKYESELEAIHKTGKRDEFAGVTHIVRTGDNGSHLLNRLGMNWESAVHTEYGIEWETHTLPKRHGFSLCDAHGGGVKRTINAFGVAHYDPEDAHEFANIINGWVCGLKEGEVRHDSCTAYAMQNISRHSKQEQVCPFFDGGHAAVYTDAPEVR